MDTVRGRRRWSRQRRRREGRKREMFKEEEQNWIKNVLWRREEVEEGNI